MEAWRALPSVACSSQNVQAHPEVQFFCGRKNTHPSYFVFVFVLFVGSCVSLVVVRTKWVMDWLNPEVCVVYVRKTSNFGPCIRNLTGQSIRRASSKKRLVRHVAPKTSKRIQKSGFFVEKKIRCFVFVEGLQENAVVTVMT